MDHTEISPQSMTILEPSTDAPTAISESRSTRPARLARFMPTPLVWAALAVVLLATSGLVRAVQDRRFEQEVGYLERCPFPLKALPLTVGGWKSDPSHENRLDELTLRITGSTDHILRNYVDELTGVSLSVLILFGPASLVVPHTPEVCYPACGYTSADDSSDRLVKLTNGEAAPFRSLVYAKSGGRSELREEVYYSFRLGKDWSPDMGRGKKFPRKNPGVFKIQVQRRVVQGERRDRDDPIEQFLGSMVEALNARIDGSTGEATKTVAR